MLYALLVEGSGPAGLGLQARRFHRQGSSGYRRRRHARVRRRLGPAAPVLPLALLYHSDLQRGQSIVPVNYALDHRPRWPATIRTSILPMPRMLREARARPARSQSATDGAGLVVRRREHVGGLAANDKYPTGLLASGDVGRADRSQRRRPGVRGPFHPLSEPLRPPPAAPAISGIAAATSLPRAFYSKFLILSGGHDQLAGRLPLRGLRHRSATPHDTRHI